MNIEWWENYNDDILIEHLKKLYETNYDLKNAELKAKESEKLVKMQFANELPAASLDGLVKRDFRSALQKFGDMSIPNFAQNNFQFPLTMSYELDIWGKNRLKTKITEQESEIVKQAVRATYIMLSSDFCTDYFNLIKTDKLISLQEEIIEIQKEILAKTKEKFEQGLCSTQEVFGEEQILTRLIEEKNDLYEGREVLINNLRVYLGESEGEIKRGEYDKISLLKNIPGEINSKAIENRPDYLQAQANIKKAGLDVKVAKREFLPSFLIFGQIGLNSYSLKDLFNRPSQLANAGVTPVMDLFSGKRKLNFLKFKKYKYEEAINDYQKTILENIKEVNLAISTHKTALKNYDKALERLELQEKIFGLIQDKNKIGSASELEVLYGREAYLLSLKEETAGRINCLISPIGIYKSIGGKNLYELNENI